MEWRVEVSEEVLGVLSVDVLCPICLCKLDIYTLSESYMPSVPMPAPTRYIAKGHPIPPAPIIATLAEHIFNCP